MYNVRTNTKIYYFICKHTLKIYGIHLIPSANLLMVVLKGLNPRMGGGGVGRGEGGLWGGGGWGGGS